MELQAGEVAMPICWKCGHAYEGEPRRCERCGVEHGALPPSTWTRISLAVGQLVSLIGCVSAAGGLVFIVLGHREHAFSFGQALISGLGCVVGLLYSWALFVVFTKVKQI